MEEISCKMNKASRIILARELIHCARMVLDVSILSYSLKIMENASFYVRTTMID